MEIQLIKQGASPPAKANEQESKGVVAREYDGDHSTEYSVRDNAVITSRQKVSGKQGSKNLKKMTRSFLLPSDYPKSVSSDYAKNRKWTCASSALRSAVNFYGTQAALTAVGIAFPIAGVAAIALMSKESLNFVGQLIGGRLAKKVDLDPKKWNFLGNAVNTAGGVAELSLKFVPTAFLPVSIIANAVKAGGNTLEDAAEVNILKHQAVAGNIGEVKAKNTNQSMIADGVGTALAVAVQVGIAASGVGAVGMVAAYAAFTAGSLLCSWKATHALQMDVLNPQKCLELFEHNREKGSLLSPDELDKNSSVIQKVTGRYGHKVELEAGLDGLKKKPDSLLKLAGLFSDRKYLIYREKDKTMIVLNPEAKSPDAIEALYTASLLEKEISSPAYRKNLEKRGPEKADLLAIEAGLKALPKDGKIFEDLKKAGWNPEAMPLKAEKRAEWGLV